MTEPGSTIERDLAALDGLTARELRERYERVFGEAARSNNRRWLLRRVAWRMQLLAEGDLAQRAVDRVRDKAATLARDADLRVRPPGGPLDPGEPARTVVGQMSPGRDERVPPPGAVLVRVFKGREHRVTVRSGGNAERPALKRLLEDIEAGLVDCVVVYKVDRLSRSLLDFARMMETFERHGVSFVSVTQQFNTAHSMGRLTLNILLSFAQFEREIISERTRDKIAAARKKGKWAGGRPVLGYDIVPGSGGSKLAVNAAEAERVRTIFKVYLDQRSLLRAAAILNDRGWTTKAWTAKNGSPQGGRRFDKAVLYKLLTNPVYVGKVRHHEDLYDGEHEAIVDGGVFAEVGRLLASNNARDGRSPLNKHGALLKGLVRCQSCGCGMCHHFATARVKGGGAKRYRYYVCTRAQKEGWSVCPGPSLPADELEAFVVEQLRALGQDQTLVADAVRSAQSQLRERLLVIRAEREGVGSELDAARAELKGIVDAGRERNGSAARAAELREAIRDLGARARRLDAKVAAMADRVMDEDELAGALESFDPMWEQLTTPERERLLRLLVQRVDWDAATETITVAFNAEAGAEEATACPS